MTRTVKTPLLLSSLSGGSTLGGGALGTRLGGHLDFDGLNHTDGNSLAHITDGETTKRGVGGEGLNAHGLGGGELDDGGITILDVLGALLLGLAGTAIDLLEELGELTGNVGSVAIQHGGIASVDLTRVVQDDDLSVEGLALLRGIVFGITSDHTTADILD